MDRKIIRLKRVIDYNKEISISLKELLLILEYNEKEKKLEELKEELYNIMYILNHQTDIYIYSFVYYKEKFIFHLVDLSNI